MGVVWSHGIRCDKVSIKKLIDNENWFGATLVEYHNLSSPIRDKRSMSLRQSYESRSLNSNSFRSVFRKKIKCSGRITVQNNCIVFQALHCRDSLGSIISHQEESQRSPDKSLTSSPSSFTSNPYYCNSQSSTSTNGTDEMDFTSKDRLNTYYWPLHAIRHFGYKNSFFSFDSGRFSSTGEGRFTFKIKQAEKFVTLFQISYSSLSQSPADKLSPSPLVSPYHNLTGSHSYRNIHLSASSAPSDLSCHIKSKSKSIEFTFDNSERKSHMDDSISPINYSFIDFSHNYANIGESFVTNKKPNFKDGVAESIDYLTICENQTKAVEEVLKRIG